MSVQDDLDREARTQASIASALQEVTEKAQLLIREEIELARTEIEVKVKSLVRGVAAGAAGGVFALLGLFQLLHGLSWLAWWALPVGDDQFFWGFFLVAAVLFLVGGIALFLALRFFKKGTPPQPVMAIDEAKKIQQSVNEARSEELNR